MENDKIFYIPSLEVFGDWETLQQFLDRRGNPLYSVGGSLDLSYSDIESLGNLTSVGDCLDLRKTNIESLGNLTSVGGYLDLYGCKDLTSLGNLTSVGGWLDLKGTNIESLGNLTSVGGSLDLENTPISKKYSRDKISNMVEIGGNIYL